MHVERTHTRAHTQPPTKLHPPHPHTSTVYCYEGLIKSFEQSSESFQAYNSIVGVFPSQVLHTRSHKHRYHTTLLWKWRKQNVVLLLNTWIWKSSHCSGCSIRDNAPSFATITRWVTEFKRRRKSIENEFLCGLSSTASIQENIGRVLKMMTDDGRLTTNIRLTSLILAHSDFHHFPNKKKHLAGSHCYCKWFFGSARGVISQNMDPGATASHLL